MIHKIRLILILTAFPALLWGQNTLSGKIADSKTNEAIIGAIIYIPDLKRSTSSDLEGNYQITNMPTGKYLVEVRMAGYAVKNTTTNVNGNTVLNVLLEEAHLETKEVIVTGVSHATELRQSPVAIKIVAKEFLTTNSGTNIIDMVAKNPGISQIQTGAGIGKPVIRGLGYNRVITMFDGIRQEGQQWGDEHGIELDEYAIDRIEILKGPASLMYGSDGIGGVLNFLPPKPMAEGKIRGNLYQNFQSNNNLYGISGDVEELNGYSLSVPRQHITHLRLSSNNNFILGRDRLSVILGYQQNLRREIADALNPNEVGLYLHLTTVTYDVKYLLHEMAGWNTSIGINGMYQINNINKGKEFLIPAYNLFDAGLFVYSAKNFGNLNISGGLRCDTRILNSKALYYNVIPDSSPVERFLPINRQFQNISGSAGATYIFSEMLMMKANISRGYRAPNIAELSANGVHEGTFRYETGNQSLKSETSLQEDLGLDFNSQHVSLGVSVFNNSIANYIYSKKVQNHLGKDSILNPSNPVSLYHFVQGNAQLYGGEIEMDIHPHPLDWLHIENAFSTVYGLNKSNTADSNKYLPNIPAAKYRGELKAQFNKGFSVFKNCYAKVEMESYFNQDKILREANTETVTPAYTLFNAGLGTDVVSKKGTTLCSFHITGNNITDVAYQNHLSRLKYAPENIATGKTGIYNMGRNFSLKLIIPIGIKI
ncbi:MAG: TonB-dependent receptor [Bacteroidetes bacterium]|nr:TonB-dependent receptor [Bacteroidota bacterium]